MSYEPYAVMLAREIRDRQIAHAAEHRLGRLHQAHHIRRSRLRPLGRLFIRLGHALGADSDLSTTLTPARPR